MPWFRVDDGFPEHPKLEILEREPRKYMAAITVWTIMGADCCRRLTDGFVSSVRLEKVLGRLGKAALDGATALVQCSLWESAEGGWRFKNWNEYQPSKSDVDASRTARNARQRRWRSQHGDTSHNASTTPSTNASHNASTNAPVDAHPARVSHPIPSHPIPGEARAVARAPGAGHLQTFRDVFAAEASRLGWSPPPELPHAQLRQAAGRALRHAEGSGQDYLASCAALAMAGLQKARAHSQPPGLAVLEAEPGQTYQPRSGARGSILRPAPGEAFKATPLSDYFLDESEGT
jgi:hypothetical protein